MQTEQLGCLTCGQMASTRRAAALRRPAARTEFSKLDLCARIHERAATRDRGGHGRAGDRERPVGVHGRTSRRQKSDIATEARRRNRPVPLLAHSSRSLKRRNRRRCIACRSSAKSSSQSDAISWIIKSLLAGKIPGHGRRTFTLGAACAVAP